MCSAEQKKNSPVQAARARERSLEYYYANHEQERVKRREAYYADPDRAREASREWYAKNKDRAMDAQRAWKTRNIEKARSYELARRAKHLGLFVEYVDRIELLNRHRGICGICREPVDCDQFDVDHIIPTSRGGEHSYANTQPAHKKCNQGKRNRLPPQAASAG